MTEKTSVFISVIIPTYNRPDQLKVCLDSLCELDYPQDAWEVIIVDDGGATPLDNITTEYSDRLDISLLRQANAGPAAARNTGARQARGELLAFTDDDCKPKKDWLRIMAGHYQKTPERIIGGKTVNRLTNNIFSATSQYIVDIVYNHYNQNKSEARFFASNNIAVPKSLYYKIGGFTEEFRTSEDRELCDRWRFQGYKLTYAPEAVIFHAHNLSLVSFCKQHFNYGRGAWKYHRLRARRGSGKFQNDLNFHSNISNWLFYPFGKEPFARSMLFMFILLLWQFINASGFFWEALFSEKDKHSSTSVKKEI